MIGPSHGYVGRRASQSVGCGGRDAYAHMCMVVGKGVGGGQSMMTAAVVVNGMVQVREGNRLEHVFVMIEMNEYWDCIPLLQNMSDLQPSMM